MKMRKKIAALLAAAMIATVMPMTAFAASTNRVSTVVRVTDKGATKTPRLNIELKDRMTSGDVFYLNLTNAKWDDVDDIQANLEPAGALTVTKPGDRELAVTVNTDQLGASIEEISIPLYTTDISGEATVEINAWDTALTEGKYVFATSSAAKANVIVGDPKSFYTGTSESIAKITIEEAALGAFAKADSKDEIQITLDNDDFEFVTVVNADWKYGKGFSNLTKDPADLTVAVDSRDKQSVNITILDPSAFADTQRGTIELDLKVKSVEKKPVVGDLNVNISGDLVDDKDFKVATIAEYGVELKVAKDYEFVAGKEVKVEFNLNEIVNDTMVEGRSVNFTLPEGVYFKESTAAKGVDVTVKEATGTSSRIDITANRDNDDDYIDGFTADFKAGVGTAVGSLHPDKIDKIKFEAKLEITSGFSGDIVLKADGRAIGEDIEVKLAEVKAPVTVKVEPMKIAVGIKGNEGGKITITETDKKMINRGTLVIQLSDDYTDMSFTNIKDLDIKTTGGIKTDDAKLTSNKEAITIEVTRQSTEAGSIEISGFEVTSRRSIADGTYEIEIGGKAISDLAGVAYKTVAVTGDPTDRSKDLTYGIDAITEVDFILVGDKLTKAEVSFVIGSNVFLVDGKEVEMDAAAYIKDGRTMVPLRFLATALGIDTESIKFNSGIVTILDGNARVIQVQVGSKNLVINGMAIPMVAAAEIIEGRTYVPVTEIGAVFGVTGNWDPATQTATFK